MSDYRDDLHGEYPDLSLKLEKLNEFILSDKYDDLPEIDRSDLKEQRKHMQGYIDVLKRRASRLCG